MTARLTILRGPRTGASYDFDDDEVTIGSGRNNSIIIRDNDVSTNHCRLIRLQQDYDLEDLNSRYGTFVNGQHATEPIKLTNGSIIELGGQVTIEYRVVIEGVLQRPHTQPLYLREGDPSTQPCLVLTDNGQIRAAYLLQNSEVSVGRSISNDIVIQETDISRNHMKLIMKNDHYIVRDLESRNGTFINNEQLNGERRLEHNDVVRLGASTILRYVHRSQVPPEWTPIPPDGTVVSQESHDEHTLPNYANTMRQMQTRVSGNAILESIDLTDNILIAYAREDWEGIVASIVYNLEDAKHHAWVDQPFKPGSSLWSQAIEQAQIECWLLLVVISPESMQSDMVRDMYRYFYNREKPIVLIDYKPVERLPIQLSQLPLIAFDSSNAGQMFRQLQFEIMQLKSRYGRD